MAEPLSGNALDLLANLGDKMVDMLAVDEREDKVQTPAQALVEQYARLRLMISEIRVQLKDFNRRVSKAFEDNQTEPLRPLMAGAGFDRLEENFRGWRADGLTRLELTEYDLLSLTVPEPLNGEVQGRRAEALTFETWRFVYADGHSREEESYNRYTLLRGDSGWQVAQVDFYTQG